jgi:predicted transcriptional regulator
LTVAAAFGYFIWKQNQFIQKELMEELDESFGRLEAIIVKLIDQQKITQLDIKQIKGYIDGIEDIMQRLTGGKLRINKEE